MSCVMWEVGSACMWAEKAAVRLDAGLLDRTPGLDSRLLSPELNGSRVRI